MPLGRRLDGRRAVEVWRGGGRRGGRRRRGPASRRRALLAARRRDRAVGHGREGVSGLRATACGGSPARASRASRGLPASRRAGPGPRRPASRGARLRLGRRCAASPPGGGRRPARTWRRWRGRLRRRNPRKPRISLLLATPRAALVAMPLAAPRALGRKALPRRRRLLPRRPRTRAAGGSRRPASGALTLGGRPGRWRRGVGRRGRGSSSAQVHQPARPESRRDMPLPPLLLLRGAQGGVARR